MKIISGRFKLTAQKEQNNNKTLDRHAAVWKIIWLKWMKRKKRKLFFCQQILSNKMACLLFLIHLFCILWLKKHHWFDWTQMGSLRILHTSKACLNIFLFLSTNQTLSLLPPLRLLTGQLSGYFYVYCCVQKRGDLSKIVWVCTNSLHPIVFIPKHHDLGRSLAQLRYNSR